MSVVGFIGLWAGLAAMTLIVLMLPTWHPPKWLCDGTGVPLFPKDAWRRPSRIDDLPSAQGRAEGE